MSIALCWQSFNCKRSISKAQAKALGEFFHLSAALFLKNSGLAYLTGYSAGIRRKLTDIQKQVFLLYEEELVVEALANSLSRQFSVLNNFWRHNREVHPEPAFPSLE